MSEPNLHFGITLALSLESTNFFTMNELKHQHQIAKEQATFYMKNGQILHTIYKFR